jgi:TPR repeat protein
MQFSEFMRNAAILLIAISCSQKKGQDTTIAAGGQSGEAASNAVVATECAGLTADDCYEEGLKLSSPLNSAETRRRSVPLLRSSCEEGLSAACYRLGIVLEIDRELKDPRSAVVYYERACDLGEFQGCRNAGNLLVRTRSGDGGVTQECRRSAAFYEHGCLGGDGPCCIAIGKLYAKGCEDLPVDTTKARKYQKLAREWRRENPP